MARRSHERKAGGQWWQVCGGRAMLTALARAVVARVRVGVVKEQRAEEGARQEEVALVVARKSAMQPIEQGLVGIPAHQHRSRAGRVRQNVEGVRQHLLLGRHHARHCGGIRGARKGRDLRDQGSGNDGTIMSPSAGDCGGARALCAGVDPGQGMVSWVFPTAGTRRRQRCGRNATERRQCGKYPAAARARMLEAAVEGRSRRSRRAGHESSTRGVVRRRGGYDGGEARAPESRPAVHPGCRPGLGLP